MMMVIVTATAINTAPATQAMMMTKACDWTKFSEDAICCCSTSFTSMFINIAVVDKAGSRFLAKSRSRKAALTGSTRVPSGWRTLRRVKWITVDASVDLSMSTWMLEMAVEGIAKTPVTSKAKV